MIVNKRVDIKRYRLFFVFIISKKACVPKARIVRKRMIKPLRDDASAKPAALK